MRRRRRVVNTAQGEGNDPPFEVRTWRRKPRQDDTLLITDRAQAGRKGGLRASDRNPQKRHDPGPSAPATLPLSGDDETRRTQTANQTPKGQAHDRIRVVTAERRPERRPHTLGTKGSGATQGTVERRVAADLSFAE